MYKNITEKCKSIIAGSSRTFAASFVIDDRKYSDIKKLVLTIPSTANGVVSVGGTISNSVEIIAEKVDVQRGQKIEVLESVKLGPDEYEDIPMGHFKITSAKSKDSLTTIVASGPLSTETSLGYFSALEYPATTVQMLNEISASIGVEIEVDNLEEIYVQKKPEGYTHREVIGFIAGIHAMNAVETRNGTIAFKWYTDCEDDIFTDKTDSPELSNELYVITKFECATGHDTWSKGLGFTGIVISNPMMTEEMAEAVWNKLSGFSYRPGSFNIKSGTPCVDPWDRLLYGEERVIATELQYVHDGGLQNTYKSSGETEISTRYKGPMATALDRYYAELLLVKNISADYMTVKEADIRYAKIDELDVITADISHAVIDTIDGRYASIGYIQTNYASMLEFDALKGKVNDLQTDMLTAESALIKNLQSMVTKTDTLIFGSAGGTSIQTEFSNSVIAMLGDAQIKSAMIDSVSASKVTSGTILTNDVTIQSKDGKTLLKDNTLQISDGTRTRVQIGKDASNDYSINVWDASGNLMFSEGGITDSAIKEAIIRDDMVSDNANINAAKLNIDSLFEEINGSSKTIKSTRVYFDSEKQTLDAAFKSMTTTVDGLKSTQTSQGTQITAIQGQITSKIWQQDINTAVDEVEGDISSLSTKYTTLNQTVNGLSSTVSSHTTSISSLGTKVASAESNITQLSNEISFKVDEDGIITAINLSKETAKINAKYIDLEGAVTFSSFDEATQTLINDTMYSVTGSMSGISGTATVEIFKNGVVCTESVYLNVTYLDGSGGTSWKSSSNGGNVTTGKKTWTYTGVRAYKIEVYTNSAKTKFLCGCILSYGATGANGTNGKDGTNGKGVSSIVEQYYLSSSSSSQTGGSWSTTCPTWKSGYYIWTRSYITWSDGTTTTTTPVLANGINTANANANTANITANTANSNAQNALDTANTASSNASSALSTANTASSNASSALSTANTASTNATSALNRATYHYGTCSTAAGTAAKAVTLSGFALYTGAMVSVYFSNANTASSPTLNVNGTGAKSIRVNNAAITSKYYWRAKDTVTFIYNGTYWIMADTSANSLLASWCSDNDKTLIDGGKIYAKSITASQIDVEDLFAQDITATGTITGVTIISNGDTSSERIKIENGMFTAGSDTSFHVNIANAGVSITNGSTVLGGIRSNGAGGVEVYNASGNPFAIKDGSTNVLTINKNSSYAGFIDIAYPIMCRDIYPGDVDCLNITCTDVRIRNGISLSELNSKIEWKNAGRVIGNNKIQLPDSYNELYLCAYAAFGGIFYSSTGIINRASVNGAFDEIFYLSGGYMPGDSRNVRVYINGTHVWLACFNQDNNDWIESATFLAYYR